MWVAQKHSEKNILRTLMGNEFSVFRFIAFYDFKNNLGSFNICVAIFLRNCLI